MLNSNGISGANLSEAKAMRGEARFLFRAQSYFHLLDIKVMFHLLMKQL